MDVISDGTNYQLSSYQVNPGLSSAFPWLSGIADRFESYIVRKLNYIYIPMIGTDKNGAVMLAPDYDAGDDNSSESKAKISSFADAKRTPVWKEMTMRCGVKNCQKRKTFYVRNTNLSTGKDLTLYDVASLNLVLSGFSAGDAGVSMGEIWVEYTFEFQTPQLEPIDAISASMDVTVTQDKPWKLGNVVTKGMANLIGVPLDDWLQVNEDGDYILNVSATAGMNFTDPGTISLHASSPDGSSVEETAATDYDTNRLVQLVRLVAGVGTNSSHPTKVYWPDWVGSGLISTLTELAKVENSLVSISSSNRRRKNKPKGSIKTNKTSLFKDGIYITGTDKYRNKQKSLYISMGHTIVKETDLVTILSRQPKAKIESLEDMIDQEKAKTILTNQNK